jgi:hypothetical protein
MAKAEARNPAWAFGQQLSPGQRVAQLPQAVRTPVPNNSLVAQRDLQPLDGLPATENLYRDAMTPAQPLAMGVSSPAPAAAPMLAGQSWQELLQRDAMRSPMLPSAVHPLDGIGPEVQGILRESVRPAGSAIAGPIGAPLSPLPDAQRAFAEQYGGNAGLTRKGAPSRERTRSAQLPQVLSNKQPPMPPTSLGALAAAGGG